jgi:hypothetical protein
MLVNKLHQREQKKKVPYSLSSTLDLPADSLPTHKRVSQRGERGMVSQVLSYNDQLGHIQLPAFNQGKRRVKLTRIKRWTGRSSPTEARTEVAKRVLEFVDELYEIVIHRVLR